MSGASETSTTGQHEATVHGHGEEHGYDSEHGSLRGYLIGFFASVVLTVIPFWLVMGGVLSSDAMTVLTILALGVIQIFVHLRYFLHIDTAQEGGWQLMGLCFTMVLLVIVLVGSIWVMGHLMSNMMYSPIGG